jgi:hypothetical protein
MHEGIFADYLHSITIPCLCSAVLSWMLSELALPVIVLGGFGAGLSKFLWKELKRCLLAVETLHKSATHDPEVQTVRCLNICKVRPTEVLQDL